MTHSPLSFFFLCCCYEVITRTIQCFVPYTHRTQSLSLSPSPHACPFARMICSHSYCVLPLYVPSACLRKQDIIQISKSLPTLTSLSLLLSSSRLLVFSISLFSLPPGSPLCVQLVVIQFQFSFLLHPHPWLNPHFFLYSFPFSGRLTSKSGQCPLQDGMGKRGDQGTMGKINSGFER